MRTFTVRLAIICALLICTGCDRPAIDTSESLVTTKPLPPAKTLAREIIQINRGFGEISPGFLSYELRPEDRLIVTLTLREGRLDRPDKVAVEERFRLQPDVAAEARRRLWRLRPSEFGGVEQDQRPLGCERRGPHDFGEHAVAFIAEGPEEGVDDDRLGVFEMPSPASCSTAQASEARSLLRKVLASFPPSKAAAEFERRKKAL
jgi:hypothetical protein